MASKRGTKSSAADELDELFEGIGDDAAAPKKPTTKVPAAAAAKQKPGDDILAELESELGDKVPSRPHTPRVRDTSKPAKRIGTPTTDAGRPSTEEPKSALPRKSGESARSLHASFTPSATSSELQDTEKTKGTVEQQQTTAPSGGGGGWWGGILSTASAAMKQAEAAVKEIQQNEEAKKWADQVRGNVGALRGLGKLNFHHFTMYNRKAGENRGIRNETMVRAPLDGWTLLALAQSDHIYIREGHLFVRQNILPRRIRSGTRRAWLVWRESSMMGHVHLFHQGQAAGGHA